MLKRGIKKDSFWIVFSIRWRWSLAYSKHAAKHKTLSLFSTRLPCYWNVACCYWQWIIVCVCVSIVWLHKVCKLQDLPPTTLPRISIWGTCTMNQKENVIKLCNVNQVRLPLCSIKSKWDIPACRHAFWQISSWSDLKQFITVADHKCIFLWGFLFFVWGLKKNRLRTGEEMNAPHLNIPSNLMDFMENAFEWIFCRIHPSHVKWIFHAFFELFRWGGKKRKKKLVPL